MDVNSKPVIQKVSELTKNLESILHFAGQSNNIDFFISSLTEFNPFNTTEEVREWLRQMNEIEFFSVEKVPLSELKDWEFSDTTGDLQHNSGGFFSIAGLEVRTNIGPVKHWTQPIIVQPEIGVLGIITKKIDGILYLLMQAKPEPGNINTFQLSPTVQATRSNYSQLHGGKATHYLDYFLEEDSVEILVDQLQSEQGGRFYRKRNRNTIVRVADDHDIELLPNFRWVTLGQLKRLMLADNTVNMDTRSVVSSIEYDAEQKSSLEPVDENALLECLNSHEIVSGPVSRQDVKLMVSAHGNTEAAITFNELLRRISKEKFRYDLQTKQISLRDLVDWRQDNHRIYHEQNKYFSVIGVRVKAANREVQRWDQPIIEQVDPGIVAFIGCELKGVLHLLVQLKMESGNMDLLELAPTVQCITGSYENEFLPLFVNHVDGTLPAHSVFDVFQSEEGGRFFKEANRNIFIIEDSSFVDKVSDSRYLWMTIKQLKQFLCFNNFLNVEARSVLALI